jgi:4'-phosphopantetheinyl transferase EntD
VDILRGLFPDGVATATGDPRLAAENGLPEEERYVARAVEHRRREFHAGRAAARTAMAKLGLEAVAIPAAPDRAPVWPSGVTGSISHCASLCVAAVARTLDGPLSIGVDVEPADPLAEDLVEAICTQAERNWLAGQPADRRMVLARTIFSAKEAVYKCQYPLTRVMLEFSDVGIALGSDTYAASFLRPVPGLMGDTVLVGRYRIAQGHIVTSAAIGGTE